MFSDGAPPTGTLIRLVLDTHHPSLRSMFVKLFESLEGVAAIHSTDKPHELHVYIKTWEGMTNWDLKRQLEKIHDNLFELFNTRCSIIVQQLAKRKEENQVLRTVSTSSSASSANLPLGIIGGSKKGKNFVNTPKSLRSRR